MLPAQWKTTTRLQLQGSTPGNLYGAAPQIPKNIPPYFRQWFNVKHAYGEYRVPPKQTNDTNLIPLPQVGRANHPRGSHNPRGRAGRGRGGGQRFAPKVGMAGMLESLGLKLEGRHHSGIDDSNNIARIVTKLVGNGWNPNAPDQVSGMR
jgi:hypothetical protein